MSSNVLTGSSGSAPPKNSIAVWIWSGHILISNVVMWRGMDRPVARILLSILAALSPVRGEGRFPANSQAAAVSTSSSVEEMGGL